MRLVTINVNGVVSSLPQDFCSYPAGDKSMVEEAVAKAVEAREEGVADRLAKAITKRKRDEENQRNTDSDKKSAHFMENWKIANKKPASCL
jgi:hypothetical protein